jgi:CMP-2-keto-3-deoxyoctulosonic acid synthetase
MPDVHDTARRVLGTFEPTSCEGLVAAAQDILARYLDPRTEVSDRECLEQLLALFDGPVAVEITENVDARSAGGYKAH